MFIISRNQLHERGLVRAYGCKLAKRYGAQAVTNLNDICVKHRIPVPSRNYWEKVAAGIKVNKTHYRSISDTVLNKITIDGNRSFQEGHQSDKDVQKAVIVELKRSQSLKLKLY